MHDDPITERVSAALASVPGVAALVLGGSRGRGTATQDSDHDFGLYYEPERPVDIAALEAAVRPLLDDPAWCTITPIGEWGPRINGGGWLSIDGRKVDLLYRDLSRVRAVIDDCKAGRITMDYQPGHPHGFCSSVYAGEIATCRPLSDPQEVVSRLKAAVLPFPAPLKRAIIGKFLWEVQFAADNAALAIKRGEQTHVAGCAYRALCCTAQVLFAINDRYLINEKGALAEAATFPVTVPRLDATVAEIWDALGNCEFPRLLTGLTTISESLREATAVSAA
jgi:Nucleotidyltransferase domain